MRNLMLNSILVGLCFSALSTFAGVCEITIDRKACPGQEKKAFEPYQGKNPTVEKKVAADAAECLKKVQDASKIVRKGTLSEKIVTGKFGAAPVGPASDKSACN